jgi:hypothetical protein
MEGAVNPWRPCGEWLILVAMAPDRFSVLDAIVEADDAVAHALASLGGAADELRPGSERCVEIAEDVERLRAGLEQARRSMRLLAGQVRAALPAEEPSQRTGA